MKVHNIQRTTLIFCALFLSTFGHGYLKAHHDSRAHIQHTNRNQHLISHLQKRVANDNKQICNWECIPENSDEDQNLQIFFNGNLGVAVYNVKEYVALVVDVEHQIGAVFNGTSGGAVLINIKTNKGYDLPSGVWTVGQQPFQQFLDGLTTLEPIWNQAQKNGTGFDISKIPDTALHHIAQVFQFLGVGIATTVRNSLKESIKLFVKYTQQLIDSLQGIDGLGKFTTRIHGDLEWLANTLKGIKYFVSKIPGGLKYLQDQGVKLRLESIFKAKSGIEAFVNLLEDIGQQVNLAEIFKDVLNNSADIVKFIIDLGGNISTGINGFFKVLYQIIAVHNDKVSLSDLLETLIRYSGSKNCDLAKIRNYAQRILKLIQAQIKKYNTDDEWSPLQRLLQKLLDPNSIAIGSISVAELLRALTNVGHESPIQTVVNILWSIRVIIKIQNTIPQLVLTILQKLNSQTGLQILIKLVPNLQLKYTPTGEIDVVGTIKDQLNPNDLSPVLNDLPKLLKRLPIIGTVVRTIENALQDVSHGEYNFDDLLKCTGAAKTADKIRKWLKNFLNLAVTGGNNNNSGNHGGIGGIINGIVGGDNSGENSSKGGKHSGEHSGKGDNNSGEHSGKGGNDSDENSGKGGKDSGEHSGKGGNNSGEKPGKGGKDSGEHPGKGGNNSGEKPGKGGKDSGEHPGKGGNNSGEKPGKGGKDSGEHPGKGGNNSGEKSDKGGNNSGKGDKNAGVISNGSGGILGGISGWLHGHHQSEQHGVGHVESKRHQIKERHHQIHH